jgi:hypothetical protein
MKLMHIKNTPGKETDNISEEDEVSFDIDLSTQSKNKEEKSN